MTFQIPCRMPCRCHRIFCVSSVQWNKEHPLQWNNQRRRTVEHIKLTGECFLWKGKRQNILLLLIWKSKNLRRKWQICLLEMALYTMRFCCTCEHSIKLSWVSWLVPPDGFSAKLLKVFIRWMGCNLESRDVARYVSTRQYIQTKISSKPADYLHLA